MLPWYLIHWLLFSSLHFSHLWKLFYETPIRIYIHALKNYFLGTIRNLSPQLWHLQHLTSLYLNNNNLIRVPPDIAELRCLVYLDLSSNHLRSLPAELGDLVELRELLLNNNNLRVLPYELGKLFLLQNLGRCW